MGVRPTMNLRRAYAIKHKLAEGQGLVEYALILVLVAIVTILIVTVLGEEVQNVFCEVLTGLGDSAPSVSACESPSVRCVGVASGETVSDGVIIEAVVTDSNGSDTIARVEFYLDGATSPNFTEYYYKYCLGRDNSCTNRHYFGSSGSHTVRAVAYDDDGNTGQCSVTFNVQ